MPRTNPAARTWGEYIRSRMSALGMTQADLRRRMEDLGEPISRQAASQWYNGENAADPDSALLVAVALEEDAPETAMRAAGYARIADALSGKPLHAGLAPEPVDEGIRLILASTHLDDDGKADAIAHYKRRKARLLGEVRALVDAMGEPGDEQERPTGATG